MTPSSAKAKGRNLQQLVRDAILTAFPSLTPDDVRSTSMGAGGVDVQMASAALKLFPYKIECKNLARIAIYSLYRQACTHKGGGEPLLIIKQNHAKPLAVVDLEYFIDLHKAAQ